MIINGKDIRFAYTVGAYCDINDYVVANPDVSLATANLQKAMIMNRAYNEMHGSSDSVTIQELRQLPFGELETLLAEIKEAEEAGNKRLVEVEEKKQKKGGA